MAGVTDFVIPLGYYRTLGSLDLKRREYDEAERAFRAVVSIGEVGLRSLTSESDRMEWERQVADAYRGLVEIRLKRDGDDAGALIFGSGTRQQRFDLLFREQIAGRMIHDCRW